MNKNVIIFMKLHRKEGDDIIGKTNRQAKKENYC